MTEQLFIWSDRTKHDGTGCPNLGAVYRVYYQSGDWDEGLGKTFEDSWTWTKSDIEDDIGVFITSYKVRQQAVVGAAYYRLAAALEEMYDEGKLQRRIRFMDVAEDLMKELKQLLDADK